MREIKFRTWYENGAMPVLILEDRRLNGSQVYTWKTDNEAPVEQYTGLKDKNCVPIYEGDIVQLPGFGPQIIKWDSGGWWNMGSFPFDGNDTGDTEIIGNIHENPELLEQ